MKLTKEVLLKHLETIVRTNQFSIDQFKADFESNPAKAFMLSSMAIQAATTNEIIDQLTYRIKDNDPRDEILTYAINFLKSWLIETAFRDESLAQKSKPFVMGIAINQCAELIKNIENLAYK